MESGKQGQGQAPGINADLLRRWVVGSTGEARSPVGDALRNVSTADLAPSSIVAREDALPVRATFVPVNVQAAPRSDLHVGKPPVPTILAVRL